MKWLLNAATETDSLHRCPSNSTMYVPKLPGQIVAQRITRREKERFTNESDHNRHLFTTVKAKYLRVPSAAAMLPAT